METFMEWYNLIPWWFNVWAILSWTFMGLVLVAEWAGKKDTLSVTGKLLRLVFFGPLVWVLWIWVCLGMSIEGIYKLMTRTKK